MRHIIVIYSQFSREFRETFRNRILNLASQSAALLREYMCSRRGGLHGRACRHGTATTEASTCRLLRHQPTCPHRRPHYTTRDQPEALEGFAVY